MSEPEGPRRDGVSRESIFSPELSVVGTPLDYSVFSGETMVMPRINTGARQTDANPVADPPRRVSAGVRIKQSSRRVSSTPTVPDGGGVRHRAAGTASAADTDASNVPASRAAARRASTSVAHSTFAMASGTLVSRVLGLVRNAILTAGVGVGAAIVGANAFDVANNIPSFMYAIIAGGIFNAILIPQIVKAYKRDTNFGDEFINRIFTIAVVILAALTIVLTIGATILVSMYTHDWSPQKHDLAVAFAYWCMPEIFFYGLYMVLGQILNAREHFAAFMWAPVLNNVISIIGFSAFIFMFHHEYAFETSPQAWSGQAIAVLGATATLGVAAQALILFIPLHRIGFRFRFRWGLRGFGLRETAKMAGWSFGALLLDQGALLVAVKMASSASNSCKSLADQACDIAANATYSQALFIYIIPYSLITVSLVTAIFTRMSTAAIHNDVSTVRKDFSFGLRTVSAFMAFFSAGMVVLALPITRVINPGHAVTPADVDNIAHAIIPLSLGLVPMGATLLVMRVFYAFGHVSTIFWIQLPIAIVYAAGALATTWILPVRWWVVGIATANALSGLVGVLLRIGALRRLLHGIDGFAVASTLTRVSIAAGISGLVGWGMLHFVPGMGADRFVYGILATVVIGLVMAVVYLVLLRVLHVRELSVFLSPMLRRFRRKAA